MVSRRTALGAVLSATVLAVTAACGGGGPAQQGGGTSSGPDLTGETLEVAATWSGIEQERERAVCRFCDTEFVGTNGPGGGRFGSSRELGVAIARTWPTATSSPW